MPQATARSIWARSSRQDLVVVGVLPEILECAREPALAGLQRRRVGDRPPAVVLVFGVEGEVHAEIVGRQRQLRRVTGPRRRHHQRCTGGDPLADRPEDTDVRGVARSEVVARQDHQAVVGGVAEAFGERGLHRSDATGAVRAHDEQAAHMPRSARSARRAAAAKSRAKVLFGSIVSGPAYPCSTISMLTNVVARPSAPTRWT